MTTSYQTALHLDNVSLLDRADNLLDLIRIDEPGQVCLDHLWTRKAAHKEMKITSEVQVGRRWGDRGRMRREGGEERERGMEEMNVTVLTYSSSLCSISCSKFHTGHLVSQKLHATRCRSVPCDHQGPGGGDSSGRP